MLGLRISGLGKGFIKICTAALKAGQVAESKFKKKTTQAVNCIFKLKMPKSELFHCVTQDS